MEDTILAFKCRKCKSATTKHDAFERDWINRTCLCIDCNTGDRQ